MSTVQNNPGERVAVAAQRQQQKVLALLHAKPRFSTVTLADLEDAYARTISDLLVSPGRLADTEPGSDSFMKLLVDAASKDVLDLLRAQSRRPEADVRDLVEAGERHDVSENVRFGGYAGEADDAAGTAQQRFVEGMADITQDAGAGSGGVEEHRLLEYIAALPEQYRTITAMVLEGMKPRHIAAQVDMTPKEVSRTWEQAQARLRTMLAKGIDETRLCALIAPDLLKMREPGGKISPALRHHVRPHGGCEACAFLIREQVGDSAAGIIGLPLPALAGAGGGGWFLFRHARRAVSQARHLLGGAGSSASGQASAVAVKAATTVALATAGIGGTAAAAVAVHHVLTHRAPPPVHHAVVATTPRATAPIATQPVITTHVATPPPTKPKHTVKHKHKTKPKVHARPHQTVITTPTVTPTATVTHTTPTVTTTTATVTTTHTTTTAATGSLSGSGLPTPAQSKAAP